MRKSLSDIANMVVPGKEYPGLPEDLKPYAVYLKDSGYCIMCIPEIFREESRECPDDYECGVPTKYVLTHPYRVENGYIYIDAPYDENLGLVVPEEYSVY